MRRLEKSENEVIVLIRSAIAIHDTDLPAAAKNMRKVDELFSQHFHGWSKEFCLLYNQMLAIYWKFNPKPSGHYRTTHVAIGYSSFPVQKFIRDKVQPPIPTSEELVARFDELISARSEKVTI